MHPSLHLCHPTESGRGVVALKSIKQGDTLLAIPASLSLSSSSNSSSSACLQYLTENHSNLSPFLTSTLILMHLLGEEEANAKKEFHWRPYLASLPPTCTNSLLHWTADEKEWLKGTSIDLSEQHDEVFTRDVLPILSSCPQPFWPASFKTRESFMSAASLVQSRAFSMKKINFITGQEVISNEGSGQEPLFMIPAVDMVNHSTHHEKRNTSLQRMPWRINDATHNGVDCFVMQADTDIASGDEVLHTYGDLSDAQLLNLYGFIDQAPMAPPSLTAGKEASSSKDKAGGKKRTGSGSSSKTSSSSVRLEGLNPHNLIEVPFQMVVESVRLALDKATDGDKKELRDFDRSLDKKVQALVAGKVMQGLMPRDSHFSCTLASPLPSSLFTTIQVLIMSAEEVEDLQGLRDKTGGERKKKQKTVGENAGDNDKKHGSYGEGSLDLGWSLLDDEEEGLGQVIGIGLVNLAESMKRRHGLMSEIKQGVSKVRCELAKMVRMGEIMICNELKKVGVLILVGNIDEAKTVASL